MKTLVNNMIDRLFHTRTITAFNILDQGISVSKFNIKLTKGSTAITAK